MPLIIYRNKEGKRIPSFSTIASQWGDGAKGLQHWYWQKGWDHIEFNDMPEANVGTLAHMLIDYYLKGKGKK